jgi:hypothetical protein
METKEKPMSRKNNENTAVLEPEVAQAVEASAASPVVQSAVKAIGGGLLAFTASSSERSIAKTQLRQTIRQHLAEVADMAKEAGQTSSAVTAKAAEVGMELLNARISGDLSPAEVSDILGDIFGVKGTGKAVGQVLRPGEKSAGKTPAGTGEEIRKRVVRAYAAYDFLNNGPSSATKYFDGMDSDTVQPLFSSLMDDDSEATLWSFYNDLGAAKREANDPTPFHLNPERIAKLATTVGENVKATAKAINGDSDLKASYAGLLQQLLIVNELID